MYSLNTQQAHTIQYIKNAWHTSHKTAVNLLNHDFTHCSYPLFESLTCDSDELLAIIVFLPVLWLLKELLQQTRLYKKISYHRH